MKNSIWVLYKSFFDAVPGQKGLLAIGFLLMVSGYFQQGSNHAELFITAGAAFLTGFTLLFAGPHFRQLASLRRHRLLPDFRKHLIISYLMALASLSIFALIGLILLEKQKVVQLIQLENISICIKWLSLSSLLLIISFFGFLPGYLRYTLWLLLISCVANAQQFSVAPIEVLLSVIIGIAIAGLCCFIYFLGIIKKPIFYTKKAVSLSKYLPGLNGSFQERGVTAVGSILLDMSDGNSSRFIRAFFTVFLVPITFACSVLLTGKHSAEQFFQNPLFIFISLMTGVMVQIHFAFTVRAKKRFIWLRIGGSLQHINKVAQKVLARERWVMFFCFGLWCAPVITLYPKTAVWLLGVSTLLWFMMLFLEQIILSLKGQLTRRAEFYTLLIFMGAVVSIIAVSNVHRQPWILWVGVVAILSLHSALKLRLKVK
jgi:hypothetical protein